MTLPNEQLEKFLELEKKATPEAIIQRVAQSRTIAPQAVRELIEARKLLKEIILLLNDDSANQLEALRKFKEWNKKAVNYFNNYLGE